MNILSIDIGSYSIKFFETTLDRKQLKLVHKQEIIINQVKDQFPEATSIQELQRKIISSFLNNEQYEGKVIYQMPNSMISSRYLELPVNNRKKAELMLPFQLDEDLPYTTNNAHFTSELIKKHNHFNAIINISKVDTFEEYYNSLEQKHILPNLLTSEISLIQNFVHTTKMTKPICILDIGHQTSKAYFIKDGNLVSNHLCHFGGEEITTIIAKSYNINPDDASIYKHENCFFLNRKQFDEVDQDQKDFALLMAEIISPLILNFRRWELGFRGRFAIPISAVYLTGGTSSIQNIDAFLSEHLRVPVQGINALSYFKHIQINLSQKENNSFFLSELMSLSQLSKTPPANFLTGNYSLTAATNIPLHSTGFIFARIALVAAFIVGILFIERLFVSSQEIKVKSQVAKMIRSSQFQISKPDQRKYKKNPKHLLKILQKKNKTIEDELKTIKNSNVKNPLRSLSTLSKVLSSNANVDLKKFVTKGDIATAHFTSKSDEEISTMIKYLQTSSLNDINIQYKKGDTKFVLKYKN